jgi:2-keto-3-deoxy-L-rhamnonate aldolase RhmA
MALKLMYITNNPKIASIADSSGVDWIFIDLEVIGKKERQGHLDTVMSKHSIKDIAPIKKVLTNAKVLVRINPIHKDSINEIEQVISSGADILMLPYYNTLNEVKFFIDKVANRAKTCLLCETPDAVDIIDEIIEYKGIDYMHIGLNDLHLGYGMKFMFQPLANGLVSDIGAKLKKTNIKFGFGGIARLGEGALIAEHIIAEHYNLGSELVILSRSFCNSEKINDLLEIERIMTEGVQEIRIFEKSLESKSFLWFQDNTKEIIKKVNEIVTTE